MKFLFLALPLLFVGGTAFAAGQNLKCTFDSGAYTLKAELNADSTLKVIEIAGKDITNGPDTDETINNNPVSSEPVKSGRNRYVIDALSGDPDYGNIYVLYVPAKLEKEFAASFRYTYYSRGPTGADYVQGTCTLE